MNKKCPFCGEKIQKNAKKCRYCGEWLAEKERKSIKTPSPLMKYYLLWIGSILVFFGTLVLSENGYISDNLTWGIVGISTLIGILSLLNLLRLLIKPSAAQNRFKYIILGIVSFALLFVLIKTDPHVFRYSPDEVGLRKTVEKQYQLANRGEEGRREIYKNFLSSSFKNSITENEYKKNSLAADQTGGIQASKYDIHGISVDGTEGYVDRTVYFCSDSSCTKIKDKSRIFRKYVYENQRWLMNDKETFCPRKKMYDMKPEFSRALSLISQRAAKDFTDDPDLLAEFNEIFNCIDIKYADSDSVMNGAEGLFQFVPGQSSEKLTILVSSRYKLQDDIVTAILLTHEYSHALTYVFDLSSGMTTDCFLNEAYAFEMQYRFLSLLNPEERQSILARLNTDPSPELRGISNGWNTINVTRGSTFEAKALNFVKSNPFYQQQCAGDRR